MRQIHPYDVLLHEMGVIALHNFCSAVFHGLLPLSGMVADVHKVNGDCFAHSGAKLIGQFDSDRVIIPGGAQAGRRHDR